MLVLTDEDAAAAALDGLEARVADQKAVLESYQPDEVSKLDSAIVEQRGNSVLLAVAADAEKPGPPWTGWSNLRPQKVPGTGTFFQTFGLVPRLSNRSRKERPDLGTDCPPAVERLYCGSPGGILPPGVQLCQNRDAALDVVQESIVKALAKSDTLRRPEYLKTWFYRILLNESMNHHRRAKRLVPLEDTLLETPVPARDPGERLDLYDAIERLDWKEQTVVRLRFSRT